MNAKIIGFKTAVCLEEHLKKYYPNSKVLSYGYNKKQKHFAILKDTIKLKPKLTFRKSVDSPTISLMKLHRDKLIQEIMRCFKKDEKDLQQELKRVNKIIRG